MARDQIIIPKLQQKISCCPQTDRIIYLGGNNHFVIVTDVILFQVKVLGRLAAVRDYLVEHAPVSGCGEHFLFSKQVEQ